MSTGTLTNAPAPASDAAPAPGKRKRPTWFWPAAVGGAIVLISTLRVLTGASDIDSMPRATTTSASPAEIRAAPAATASVPDRHTAFRVMAGTVSGIRWVRRG